MNHAARRFSTSSVQLVLRTAVVAYLAMGFTLACSASDGPAMNEDVTSDHAEVSAVPPEQETSLKQVQFNSGLIDASPCQKCEPKVVCDTKLVSCDPPIFVNGKEIKCLEEDCKETVVCTPCGGSDGNDEFGGIDLGGRGGDGSPSPVDPLPFQF